MMLRTVVCGCCYVEYKEINPGEGFPNWGQMLGVSLGVDENPYFCPSCLTKIMEFADGLDKQ